MTPKLRAVTVAVFVACTGVVGQEPPAPAVAAKPAELTLDDVFDLTRAMAGEPELPIGWIDGKRYLAWGALPGGGEAKPQGFLAVDAATGVGQPWLDGKALEAAIAALPGFSSGLAKAVVGDRDAFHWAPGYQRALLNIANDLFCVTVEGARVVRITNSPSPEVGEDLSPDGRLVAYIRDDNLYVAPTDGGPERALTAGGHRDMLFGRLDWVYQEELYGRGDFKGFWWSTDSTRIALLRLDESPVPEFTLVSDTPTRPIVEVENYPKAGDPNPRVDLGVVDVRGGGVRWFDLSRYGNEELLISRVQWHPGSGEVYFQVQDRVQHWLDLLAGDPRDGRVRVVVEERSDTWVEADVNPHWLDGGKSFLWLSERDGFKHLYHYGRDGKLIRRLTEGTFEVDEIVGVDEAARVAYFLSDRDDVKEQNLWRIGLDGQGAARITKAAGTHAVAMAPDYASFVDTLSSVDVVRRVELQRMDGEVVRRIADSDMGPWHAKEPCVHEFVQVAARDGFVMEASMIKPRGFEAGKRYPVMCFTYSGPHAPQVRNRWGGRNYVFHQMLAQQGYLVWVCDNRSGSGKGRVATDACFHKMGQVETQDLEDGVKWLVDQGLADSSRVGIWGWSYGGYQTCYCLTHSKVWKLGIAVNPVTDWKFYDSIYTERYMGLPSVNRDGYHKGSVLEAAGNLHGDLLLVAATMDDNVHPQNSLSLMHALQHAGKQFRFMAYPRVRHGIESKKQQRHLFEMMADFVREKL
ncbi:MAG: DPP IV N-terminal domain-containing protein [Planctomycetota bacterium]